MAKATFGLEENVASAACYVLAWVTGIIFYIVEKDNKTVRFHAMQSILTFLPLSIIAYIVGSAAWFMWGMWFIFSMISWLIWLITFILWLLLMYKAYKGEKFLVPIVGAIAENMVK